MAVDKYEDVIPKDTTKFRLTLRTNINLNDFSLATDGAKFIVRKPDGTVVTWQGQIDSDYKSVGKIYIDFNATVTCDAEGIWRFWSKLIFSDTTEAKAKRPVLFLCVSEGDIIH